MSKSHILCLFLIFIANNAYSAGSDVLIIFDNSPEMEEFCTNTEYTNFQLAQEDMIASFSAETDFILITPDKSPSIIRKRLKRLEPISEHSNQLLKHFVTEKNQIIFYTANRSSSLLGQLQQEKYFLNKKLEIRVTSPYSSEAVPKNTESTIAGATLRKIQCPEPSLDEFSYSNLLSKTKTFIHRNTGIPKSQLLEHTNLYEDYGLDYVKIYELIRDLAQELSLVPPEENFTVISEIANYFLDAEEAHQKRGMISALSAEKEFIIQKVFYGTNRHLTGQKDIRNFFNKERDKKQRLHYGVVDISIPSEDDFMSDTLDKGRIETPFTGISFSKEPRNHIFLKAIQPLNKEKFIEHLKNSITNSEGSDWSQDALVFVHGFNVSFEEAARRTAQIAYDINFTGAPIFFSWPSDAKIMSYAPDREDVLWSVSYIESFLEEIVKIKQFKRIHLIAHGMGNQGLIGALYQMALKSTYDSTLFENVILAAPDFDADIFGQQIAPVTQTLSKNWTIYSSDNDVALNLSTKLNTVKRLGSPITLVHGMHIVDASSIEVTPWNVPEFHAYYDTKLSVITDIISTIKGIPPQKRNLQLIQKNETPYWKLNEL